VLTSGKDLATIFQPGIIAHPDHEMLPSEHAASQKVLEFLINKQDHFLIGMELVSASTCAAQTCADDVLGTRSIEVDGDVGEPCFPGIFKALCCVWCSIFGSTDGRRGQQHQLLSPSAWLKRPQTIPRT
jgi:hypothetical protein